WDSFYFLHITEEGYIFEQEHAFFPLYPLLTRGLGNSFLPILGHSLTYKQILIFSGVLISNVSFVLASINLYSLRLFNDEKFAFITSMFYIITPSCMFMSAMYTESLFAFLSFLGMRLFAEKKYWKSAVVWLLASSTRSNGIVYIGFFFYELLIREMVEMNFMLLMKRLMKATLLSIITASGFFAFQLYGYDEYCILLAPIRPWCYSELPILYPFVQKHYWNCGFLRYYEVKQIPNFLLASPMIALSLFGIYKYANYDYKRVLSLGLTQTRSLKSDTGTSHIISSKTSLNEENIRSSQYQSTSSYFSNVILPFIYLWTALLLYAITSMHIQVITRFFSSQPTVYWFASYLFINSLEKDGDRSINYSSMKDYHHDKIGNETRLKEGYKPDNGAVNMENDRMYPDEGHDRECSNEDSKIKDEKKDNERFELGHIVISYFILYGVSGIILFAAFFPPA
ncbi:17227_t:CDS:2, partial [Acaulospora morrowiae]